jgi:phage gp36-like protein
LLHPIITASADKNTTTAAVKNTATSNTSGLQYRYSTPVEDPAVILKVVNCALDVPVSITQRELLSISPEAWKQYKELTTMQRVSARTTEVGKLEEVPDDSPAVYSGCTIHDPDGTDDL